MSHVKAGGSVRQHKQSKRKGKSLGLKKAGGQTVAVGNIILRQRGSKTLAGNNVGMGRDHTIFAMKAGQVTFTQKKGKSVISVEG